MWWVKFYLLCVLIGFGIAKKQISIGGIFHNDNYEAEMAFRYSIVRENMYNSEIQFLPIIKHIDRMNSFEAENIACELANEGVAGIFGPSSIETFGIVASICNELGIPHINTMWEPEIYPSNHLFSRSLHPINNLFTRALAEIIQDYDWTGFTILYDNDDSLMRLEDVLKNHNPGDEPITIRQLDDDSDYRSLLKEVQQSGESRIIIDCSPDKILNIFQHASEVKMLELYQNYIITSPDGYTIDLTELNDVLKSNITTIRLINHESFDVSSAVHEWRQGEIRRNGSYTAIDSQNIKTESALLYDAVRLYISVLREFNSFNDLSPNSLNCAKARQWKQGARILEAFDKKIENGMTGPIEFNEKGQRVNFFLEILEYSKGGYKKIAEWNRDDHIHITRPLDDAYAQIGESIKNKFFIVSSRLGMPFLKLKVPAEGEGILEGNDRYEGYSIDLIELISKALGFRYQFEVIKDIGYGSFNTETKKWDGLIKQLLDRKADLAICDLTITYSRRTAVDFSMPFMTLGISILFAKPIKEPPSLFSFLSPLSLSVWLYSLTAYLLVSLFLFGLARMSSEDWENPHPCDDNPEELENLWTFTNCTWLTVGSILQQGCDLLPKGASTRLIAGSWWFFALIVISSYTANLAAFLTMERMDAKINGAADLAKQHKIKYGAVSGGSTLGFFKGSNFSLYQRMYAAMESAEPSVFVKNNEEGEIRVAKSARKYAFFMESSSIEYIINRNCNLTKVGGLLDSKGYGIAMPMNSPYRTHISHAILKLQEEGKLHRLKEKWWKEMNVNAGGPCEEAVEESSGNDDLEMGNVGGVFLVLVGGCACGLIIGFSEFIWNCKEVAIAEKITPWQAMKEDLLFALDVRISSKPVRGQQSDDSISNKSSKSSKSSKSNKSINKSNKSINKSNKSINKSSHSIDESTNISNKSFELKKSIHKDHSKSNT